MSQSVHCFQCGSDTGLSASQDVSRREECHHCSQDLRCCRMCQHYDPSAYNECREPMAERVVEKEKSNFCDYFKLASGGKSETEDALKAAQALFKN